MCVRNMPLGKYLDRHPRGAECEEMVRRRVQTRIERKRTGPEEWLVVTRQPLSDDRTLGPRASRDATDQDARYRYQYYLTPTAGPKVAFKEPSLGELARVIKAGTCIEASFKRGKGEVGMDEYQVRTVRRESTIEQCGNTIGYTGIR